MPLGEGWWLDLRTGKAIDVYEHASAVAESPKTYRIDPREIEGLSPFSPTDRNKIGGWP